MKVRQNHLCPACRVERPTWEVKGAQKVKQEYASRLEMSLGAVPPELRELMKRAVSVEPGADAAAGAIYVTLDLEDRCGDCGQAIAGRLVVEYDEPGDLAVLGEVIDTLSRFSKVEHAVAAARFQRANEKAAEAIP